ncbi:MAG: ATPase [Paludibacteraceae bacterium]|nr:ATPase [Paludibacteraceae bacterium]
MILIADSGSTKTDWRLCSESAAPLPFQTIGLNPFFVSPEEMRQLLSETFADYLDAVTEIYFYGAGCVPAKIPMMEDLFRQLFTHATVFVASDLLGAARAVCGREPGIACILGTGSNSCLYDGNAILSNVSPLGFILGDEGSGAVLGRLLVADYLKHQMPEVLREDFAARYKIVPSEVIERVYRQSAPNRYLANFARFIAYHLDNEYIQNLVDTQFMLFFTRNVMQYEDCRELPVSFVGSVAYYLKDNLMRVASGLGLTVGNIIQSPIEGLRRFHAANSR